ncbi:MAG: hypothetical protein A3E85_03625 [Gammaproteobacteria bacterium RIFCSPHIGHO2_12_FULL_45_12]|nr:MAG: hypothetical protein A3E85_03625 [Gammaproteobacteria bacterium RIFCSPHIGHO2_12_FULL_45_12]
MARNDKNDKINFQADDHDETDGEGGDTGHSGQIEFHDFLASNMSKRDDLAPATQKQLLKIHEATHAVLVKKQHALMTEREAVKNGKKSLSDYRQAKMGGNQEYQVKSHPILSQQAQFSGVDKQVNSVPDLNEVKTNDEKNHELKYQYNLRNDLKHTPRFNPKPQPR